MVQVASMLWKRKTVAPSSEHIPPTLNRSNHNALEVFESRWGLSTTNTMEWCDDVVDDGRRFDLHGHPRFWFDGGKAANDERGRVYFRSVAGASEADECLSELDQRRHFSNPDFDRRAYL